MKKNESETTTKRGRTAGGTEIKTASPAGHEEIEAHEAKESIGAKEATAKQEQPGKMRKTPMPEQPQNPKRTHHSESK